jgi:hypothetical protein
LTERVEGQHLQFAALLTLAEVDTARPEQGTWPAAPTPTAA